MKLSQELRRNIDECLSNFLAQWDDEKERALCRKQSQAFRTFWQNVIVDGSVKEISEEDLSAIQILHGMNAPKENTVKDVAEGKDGSSYADPREWRRIFSELKEDHKARRLVDAILRSKSDEEQIILLNRMVEENRLASLTIENAVAINELLFAYNPEKYPAVSSLEDRKKIIQFFEPGDASKKLDESNWGQLIVQTRNDLFTIGKDLQIQLSLYGLSRFLASENLAQFWKQSQKQKELGQEILADPPKQEMWEKEEEEEVKELLPVETLPNHVPSRPSPIRFHNPFDDARSRRHVVGELINFRGMVYAPVDEDGMMFLFSKITEDLGIKTVTVQDGFPNAECIKYDDEDGKAYRIFIQFEYRSGKLESHLEEMKQGHQCDYVVCWEHDWKESENYAKVVCLKDLIRQLPAKMGP